MEKNVKRCDWANKSLIEQEYHDQQWGKPIYDDKELFKMLILEGMQAGLSWSTVLRKIQTLSDAFDNFDPDILINYDKNKETELMKNEGVIRNLSKIKSVAINAKAYYKVRDEFGTFNEYLWGFVDHKPIVNRWKDISEVPAKTELSDRISFDMKERGFKFVGSTIVYAFMQSVGMVNDHLLDCDFRGAQE